MRLTGSILTLDLGVRAGFAKGPPGEAPQSGYVILKRSSESVDVAFGNLIAFLSNEMLTAKPVLLVKEAMLPLEAFRSIGNAESTVRAHAGFHAIVEGMCRRFGVPWENVSESTARKHFIGKGRLGNREDTKAAVVARCHLLGLMPKDSTDDNQADALAAHDWACAMYGSNAASITNFQLFEQHAIGGKKNARARR